MSGAITPATTHLLVVQGVLGYAALMQVLAWRARPDRYLHRWISAFCLLALVFSIARMLQLQAADADAALHASRAAIAAGNLMCVAWLGALRASGAALRPVSLQRVFSTVGVSLSLIALLTPWVDAAPCRLHTDLFGRTFYKPSGGILQIPQHLWILSVGIWSGWSARASHLERAGEYGRALALLTLFLAPFIINESLFVIGAVDTFYALEYGFAACGVALNLAVMLRSQRIEHEQLRLRSRFVEEVLEAQEEERKRIARELHDEAGQSLTSVLVGLHDLEHARSVGERQRKVWALQQVTRSTLDELGRMARGLHPQVLDDFGFTAAVQRYASELGNLHGISVDVECVGISQQVIPPTLATALYRLVQEGLTNAIRHGEARHVSVVLQRDSAGLRITIEDDGQGFDRASEPNISQDGGLGLHAMRERVELLGGTVEVESSPGEGTTLTARVPLDGSSACA